MEPYVCYMYKYTASVWQLKLYGSRNQLYQPYKPHHSIVNKLWQCDVSKPGIHISFPDGCSDGVQVVKLEGQIRIEDAIYFKWRL